MPSQRERTTSHDCVFERKDPAKEFCIRQPAGGARGMLEQVALVGDISVTDLQPAIGINAREKRLPRSG